MNERRTRYLRGSALGAIAALVLTVLAIAQPTWAASQAPEDMMHGRGVVTIGTGDDPIRRLVEVWMTRDGRYRVITASLGDTKASEEVTYDGRAQTAYVADPAGSVSIISGRSADHFAIPSSWPSEGASDGPGLELTWTAMKSDISLLSPTFAASEPAADTLLGSEARDGGSLTPYDLGAVTASSGCSGYACSKTFPSIIDGTACVDAYNYRKTSNGYFRASSTARGSCVYMDVSLWKGTATGFGCSWLQFLGSGPTSSGYSSKYVYTNPTNMTPTCSTHAGWLSDWSLVVPWAGLDTA